MKVTSRMVLDSVEEITACFFFIKLHFVKWQVTGKFVSQILKFITPTKSTNRYLAEKKSQEKLNFDENNFLHTRTKSLPSFRRFNYEISEEKKLIANF